MNGLWNSYSTRNLRILLNNNGGGEIFGMLPGLNKSEVLHEYIAALIQPKQRPGQNNRDFSIFPPHKRRGIGAALTTLYRY